MFGLFKGKRVLVTGATGFIGAHLVRSLVSFNCKVFIIVRQGSDTIRIKGLLPEIDILRGDLGEPKDAVSAITQASPEIIFHLAAAGVNPGITDPQTIVKTNALSTLNILEALRNQELSRFIYAGSCFEYGGGSNLQEEHPLEPTGVYGASKAAGWLLCKAYHRAWGLPTVTLRPFTPYGPMERLDRLIPHVINCGLRGEDIPLTGGEQERDFVYVQDVVNGFLLAAVSPAAVGMAINLCSGTGVPIKEVVLKILSHMNFPVKPLFGAKPYRDGEMWQLSGDNKRAKEILGWVPETSLDEGLQESIKWYQDNLEMAKTLST